MADSRMEKFGLEDRAKKVSSRARLHVQGAGKMLSMTLMVCMCRLAHGNFTCKPDRLFSYM